MADGELLDAREAMALLGINENDLQTLVARGDLRAFRSAGTMKFRRDDVGALKTEKGTEPTIIIPAAISGRKGASGILPSVPMSRPGSRVLPAVVPAPVNESGTSEIMLDDIELSPLDDNSHTQQVTVSQSAVGELGGATVVDSGAISGEMTVMEGGVETGPAPAITGSGRRMAVAGAPAMAAPAMSRVRAAVGPGASASTSKRSQAAYRVRSASPLWTGLAILNTVVIMLAASICSVMMRGSYDPNSGERIIPPFLSDKSTFKVYEWFYESTPGNPQDKKPGSEYSRP